MIQGEAEQKGDLICVHGSGPPGPGGDTGHLREVIQVHVVPSLGVLVGKVQHGAGELPVACHPVHGHPVGDGVVGVQPVGVLILNRFPLEIVGEGKRRRRCIA